MVLIRKETTWLGPPSRYKPLDYRAQADLYCVQRMPQVETDVLISDLLLPNVSLNGDHRIERTILIEL